MADPETKSQPSHILTLPFEIRTHILRDLVRISNRKAVAIFVVATKGVLNRNKVKARTIKVWGALLTSRQFNKELKQLLCLFPKMVVHAASDCTHTYHMPVPACHLTNIKHLIINDCGIEMRPALLDQLPHLEVLHFLNYDNAITTIHLSLSAPLDIHWVDPEAGTELIVEMILERLFKLLGRWPQAMLQDHGRTYAMRASALLFYDDWAAREQWSGVAIITASTSLRANTSRWSRVLNR